MAKVAPVPKAVWSYKAWDSDTIEGGYCNEEPADRQRQIEGWCSDCPTSTDADDSWKQYCCNRAFVREKMIGETDKKDKCCGACPTTWSVEVVAYWDTVFWEEEILTCNKETAMTTIYENAAKAASLLD